MRLLLLGVMCLGIGLLTGCDKPENQPAPQQQNAPPATAPIVPVVQVADWCREHGMPESVCVQCNPELAEKYKKAGDWCTSHNVPESQCFKCNPSLKDKFAAAYKQKYGKEPPPME